MGCALRLKRGSGIIGFDERQIRDDVTEVPLIDVEAAVARPCEQTVVALRVPTGTTVLEVLQRSGLLQADAGAATTVLLVGICGRRVGSGHVVTAGDRVELYRPLIASPKQARRRRAQRRQNA